MNATLQAQQRGPALLAIRIDKRGVVLSATAVTPDLAKPTSVPVLVAAGVRGPAGASSATHLHSQPSASALWIINHNLGYRPAVSAFSLGSQLMLANVIHSSINQARIEFDGPVAGFATCS